MIDPKFWSDDKIIELEPLSRLCFIGLWNFADDFGIHKYNARVIKAEIFPADDIAIDKINTVLNELLQFELIELSENNELLRIKGWNIYQKINRPQPSKYSEQFGFPAAIEVELKPLEIKPIIKKEPAKASPQKAPLKPYKEKVNDYYDNITDEFKGELKEAYPNVDIEQELKESRMWLITNTNKAKKNFDAFITRWMAKQMESASFNNGPGISNKITNETARIEAADQKRKDIQKKQDDYVKEMEDRSNEEGGGQDLILDALQELKNKRKARHDAIINPESSSS